MHKALVFVFFVLPVFGCDLPEESPAVQDGKSSAKVEPELQKEDPSPVKTDSKDAAEDNPGKSLFDGKSLNGWETIEFGGEGEVEVVDGEIRLNSGDPLTGICVTDDVDLPLANYEVALEGMKIDGSDFFCALTFPVNDSWCTLVVGGWGGTLVGLSNLDGQDASSNQTKLNRKFEKNRWYKIRVRVLPDRISVWIDDEKLIDESIDGVEVGIRGDVATTTPLGITSFMTTSAIRNIKLRNIE